MIESVSEHSDEILSAKMVGISCVSSQMTDDRTASPANKERRHVDDQRRPSSRR